MVKLMYRKVFLVLLVILIANTVTTDIQLVNSIQLNSILQVEASGGKCLGASWNNPDECAVGLKPGQWFEGDTTGGRCLRFSTFISPDDCVAGGGYWFVGNTSGGQCLWQTSYLDPDQCVGVLGQWYVGSTSGGTCYGAVYSDPHQCVAALGQWSGGQGTYISSAPPPPTTQTNNGSNKITITTYENRYNYITETEYIDYSSLIGMLESKGLGNNSSNSNTNISSNSGEITGSSNKDIISDTAVNILTLTNVPDSGRVNSLGKEWKPELQVLYKGKTLMIPVTSGNVKSLKSESALSELNKTNDGTTFEVVMYQVTDLSKLKNLTSSEVALRDIFKRDGSIQKAKYLTVSSAGVVGYDTFSTNESGSYIIGVKTYDGSRKGSAEDKTSYSYTPVEVNFNSDLGYLPVTSNSVTKINELFMVTGSSKVNHNISDLKYHNSEKSYMSMKVPSAYNYQNNFTLVGSTNGGVKLMDSKMQEIPLTSTGIALPTLKVNGVQEYNEGFLIATDKGICIVDPSTKEVKTTTVTTPVNDIIVTGDTVYSLSDTMLSTYFILDNDLVGGKVGIDLTTQFSDISKKAGYIEIIGGTINISSKDEGVGSEVLVLSL